MQENKEIAVCMIDAGVSWDEDMGSRIQGIQKFLHTNCWSATFTEVSGRESLAVAIGLDLQKLHSRGPGTLVLHIGCEGGSGGINFSNGGEEMGWRSLLDILDQVRAELNIRPILCLSGHHPFKGHIIDALKIHETPPVSMVIENTREVIWTDSIVAYMSFYHRLLNSGSVVKAVDVMKMASGNSSFHLEDNPSVFRGSPERKLNRDYCDDFEDLLDDLESLTETTLS